MEKKTFAVELWRAGEIGIAHSRILTLRHNFIFILYAFNWGSYYSAFGLCNRWLMICIICVLDSNLPLNCVELRHCDIHPTQCYCANKGRHTDSHTYAVAHAVYSALIGSVVCIVWWPSFDLQSLHLSPPFTGNILPPPPGLRKASKDFFSSKLSQCLIRREEFSLSVCI